MLGLPCPCCTSEDSADQLLIKACGSSPTAGNGGPRGCTRLSAQKKARRTSPGFMEHGCRLVLKCNLHAEGKEGLPRTPATRS